MLTTLLVVGLGLLQASAQDPTSVEEPAPTQEPDAEEVLPIDDAQIAEYNLGNLGGNYVVGTWRNQAYTFHYDDVVTYSGAEDACALFAVPVLSIETKAEQLVIQHLIKKVRNVDQYSGGVWLNAHYNTKCEYYKDGNGKIFYQTDPRISLGYSNWVPLDEPRIEDGNCVAISFSQNFKWWTYSCDAHAYTYICEWDHCARWINNEGRCNREKGCFYDRGDGFCFNAGQPSLSSVNSTDSGPSVEKKSAGHGQRRRLKSTAQKRAA